MNLMGPLMLSMMLISCYLMLLNNPMNMVMMIMLLTINMSFILSLSMSSWFALILLLIYIGGMMVMFSYFVSLCSNDSMMLKSKMYYIILPMVIMEMPNLQILMPMFKKSQINNLYSSKNLVLLLMFTLMLLIMMIIIIKMVKINNAPLRGFSQFS